MKIEVVQPAEGPICDFCSERPVKWRYPAIDIKPAESISLPELKQSSIGDWAACQTCHDLIEAENWPDLARRSAQSVVMSTPKLAPVYLGLVAMSRALHTEFRAARTGPATPVD